MAEQRIESALPLNQYLVRPKRKPGEGLSAWLNRHFLMNGLPLPWRLRSQIILSYRHRRNPERRVELLERINDLLPIEARVQPESWVAWCFEQQPSNAADWQSSSRQYYPHGFCPECLREWGYFLELWEIPGVSACPRHGGKLLLACPACGHDTGDWQWVDGLYQCQCGLPLKDFAADPADHLSIAWARKIAMYPGITLPPGYSFAGHPPEVALPQALQLMRVMGSLKLGFHGRLDEYRLFFDWPTYPRTLLRRLVRRVFTNDERLTKLVTGKGSLAYPICQLLAKLRLRKAPLLESLLRVELSHHCLFVFGDAVLFVNPKKYPEGAAPLRQKFAAWWGEANWDDCVESVHATTSCRYPCRFHRPLVIGVILTLLGMADRSFQVALLNSLQRYWVPSPSLREGCNPHDLIDWIARELYGLPLERLRGVAEQLSRLNGGSLVGYD